MEEVFKENLIKMRGELGAESFATALFESLAWECFDTEKPKEEAPSALPIEKEKVIESLQEYANKKAREGEEVTFKGGSIAFKKPLPENYKGEHKDQVHYLEFNNLYKNALNLYEKNLLDTRYLMDTAHSKSSLKKAIKVLFVTDKINTEVIESENLVRNTLSCFLNEEVNSLFEKMIGAMGLTVDDFLMSKCSTDSDLELVNQEVLFFRPQFVITLGASSSNTLLGIKERLSNIHGQFFERVFNKNDINEFSFTICPLFNPEFLLINPNMKRTAWVDMQKVMKELGH